MMRESWRVDPIQLPPRQRNRTVVEPSQHSPHIQIMWEQEREDPTDAKLQTVQDSGQQDIQEELQREAIISSVKSPESSNQTSDS